MQGQVVYAIVTEMSRDDWPIGVTLSMDHFSVYDCLFRVFNRLGNTPSSTLTPPTATPRVCEIANLAQPRGCLEASFGYFGCQIPSFQNDASVAKKNAAFRPRLHVGGRRVGLTTARPTQDALRKPAEG